MMSPVRHSRSGRQSKGSAKRWLMAMGLLLGISAPLSAQPSSWDFPKDVQGWRAWGTQQKTEEDKQAVAKILAWDSSKGHQAAGAIRIWDATSEFNPYVISTDIPVATGKSYLASGYVWLVKDQPLPVIMIQFLDGSKTYVSSVSSDGINQTIFQEPDANGWRRFELPVSKVPDKAATCTIGLRPAPDYKDKTFQGQVWLDDVQWTETSDKVLSLSTVANRAFRDDVADDGKGGWTDQGDNDLRGMKPGRREFAGVMFEVIDPAKNNGKAALILRSGAAPTFAQEAEIPVSDPLMERVYLLHTAAWARSGSLVGQVEFVYQDGSSKALPVRAGTDVADWWGVGSLENAVAIPVEDANPQKSPIGLYVTSLENPSAKSPLKAIRLKAGDSGGASPIWMVLAATGSNGPSKMRVALMTQRDMSHWVPFVVTNQPTAANAVSLSFLLDAPAGKHGFVRVGREGNLEFDNGTPVRFWGTNIHSVSTLFPTHQQAEMVAATLARLGCNLVRFHLPENTGYLLRRDAQGKRIPPTDEQWEPFDYFVKCLKDKGIYILLDSLSGLSAGGWQPQDGVSDHDRLKGHQSWCYFDPVLRAHSRQFTQWVLAHKNPYLGKPLAQDPVLALITTINEQSSFWDWSLKEQPPYYANELKKQFNQWLIKTHGNRDALAKAWTLPAGGTALKADEDPAKGNVEMPAYIFNGAGILGKAIDPKADPAERVRMLATVKFLHHLQVTFYQDIKAITDKHGLRIPIIGTNIISDFAELHTMLDYRISSQNIYWDHVQSSDKSYGMHNIPSVTVNPLTGGKTLSEPVITSGRSVGTAVTSTELDTMWPHEWRSSHLIGIAAYGALQKQDALMQYAYAGGFGLTWDTIQSANAILHPTSEGNDPAMVAPFVAGSLLYLRGDVSPAKAKVRLQLSPEMTWAAQGRLRDGSYPLNYVSFVSHYEHAYAQQNVPPSPNTLVITDRGDGSRAGGEQMARKLDAELKAKGLIPADAGLQDGRIVSDTKQIVRDWKNQRLTVDTPMSQAFTGFPTKEPVVLSDVTLLSQSPFVTMQVSSLDNQPIAQSRRMLLVCMARADNQGASMSFSSYKPMPMEGQRGEFMTYQKRTGKGPTLIEPVKATLRLAGQKIRLTPLDPAMVPVASAAKEFSAQAGKVDVAVDAVKPSVWYLLERLP